MTYRYFRNGKQIEITPELRHEMTKNFVESMGYRLLSDKEKEDKK